jgi:hypothetical protein
MAVCLTGRADDDLIGFRTSRFMDKTYSFKITKTQFEKAPRWKKGEEFPPLSPAKARDIALAQAKSLRPEVTNWNVADIRLTPLRANDERWEGSAEWIYMIRLQDFSMAPPSSPRSNR